MILALQAALPNTTELPPDSGLVPRHARALRPPVLAPFPQLATSTIFDPARASAGGGAEAGDDVRALGVVTAGRRAAVLLKVSGAPAKLAHAGDSLGGWKVVSITADSAWVAKGDVKRRLPISAGSAAAAAAPAQSPTE